MRALLATVTCMAAVYCSRDSNDNGHVIVTCRLLYVWLAIYLEVVLTPGACNLSSVLLKGQGSQGMSAARVRSDQLASRKRRVERRRQPPRFLGFPNFGLSHNVAPCHSDVHQPSTVGNH